jgi:ppGpp synthetase/RelA/SpoT-type nucleotidyltranferase
MNNHYVYPLREIIDAPTLEKIFLHIRKSIENKSRIDIDRPAIQQARAEYFQELKTAERTARDFAGKIVHSFMPEGHEILWMVKAICPECGGKEIQDGISSEKDQAIFKNLLLKIDEQRTEAYVPVCRNHESPGVVKKSCFIYVPKEPKEILWAELRMKECSGKITDKLFGIRPLRDHSIQNNVGEIVQDVLGVRLIVPDYFVAEQDNGKKDYREFVSLNNKITGFMQDFQAKGYIGRNIKPNGYEAIHNVGRIAGIDDDQRIMEIQLRTQSMHKNAEAGTASHDIRNKEIWEERKKHQPEWNKVHDLVKMLVSPHYRFVESSE